MRKQKILNTAVKITDKGGNSYIYDSIEKATITGLSEQAIKIRANKGTVGKDGLKCEWIDPSTKKHFQAKRSKQKGSKLELDIIHKLNEIGYNTVSSRSNSKMLDNSKVDVDDLDGNLPIYIQAKATQTTPSYFKIREECPLKDKPFTVVWKKQDKEGGNSPGTVFIAPIELLWDYLYLKLNNG